VADARAEGDLKENAEYHGQREAQGMLQAKINQLKTKLANTYIVEKSEQAADVVSFGSLVTLKDLKFGDEEKYEIVGPGEEDYDSDILKILATSPMAVAMMGKKPGDHFEFEAPRGVQKYEIVAIELP
jgi:transcription elongation factor GreA